MILLGLIVICLILRLLFLFGTTPSLTMGFNDVM